MKKFDKSDFITQFKEETNEHLIHLEKYLLGLEKKPKDEKLLGDMMRESHTLKGSATMMGYNRIAELAHKFEDALSQIKKGIIEPNDMHFNLLLDLLDLIKPLLQDKLYKAVTHPVGNLEKKIDEIFGITPTETKVVEHKPRAIDKVEVEEPKESLRVDVEKLNLLMNLVGELVVGKIEIEQQRKNLGNFLSKLEELIPKLSHIESKETLIKFAKELKKYFNNIIEEFDRTSNEVKIVTTQIQENVMGVRMLPLDLIFRKFPRLVRDLSKEENKLIELIITGEETELDKTVIEKIQDPLMHILRNAVSHGIETPEERKKLKKNEIGRIELRAYYKGPHVIIEVEDDGRGIDTNKVKEIAIKKGILAKDEIEKMPPTQALYLLFTQGMSTKDEVSQISGRGVGLDVVKTNVSQLKGILDINSILGKGTKFTIKLPLTLAVTFVLFVNVDNETFAIPLDNVEQTIRITHKDIKKIETMEFISVKDEIIPLVNLGKILGLKQPEKTKEVDNMPVVIVRSAEKKLALLVDELAGNLEIVAKSLGDHLKKVPYIAGCTILGTGEVIPILDIPSLVMKTSILPGQAIQK